MLDIALNKANAQVSAAQAGVPIIKAFFDQSTFTVTYVVHDPESRRAAIIDSVLDYDPASGRTSSSSADAVIAYVEEKELGVDWLLETHAHADHLSAAPYLQQKLGGKIAIGEHIVTVQNVFGKLFNAGGDFRRDGSDFDQLWKDGDQFAIGNLSVTVLHVPGHTPACIAYVIGDAVYVGDTMFMPDYGTARADFPGGDARTLYRSARRLLSLPPETRLFMCHDYLPSGRTEYVWETTVEAERKANIHIHDGQTEDDFVAMREARDAKLDMPRLILPSVQVNMRAGHMPAAEENGVTYLKIPVNAV
ncbi:MBL fold metallo-hydrolase [Novosphingobium sp. AAP83]|uniref:MBL fold metallo-hydrolase n=1 Tax=Novosphingobium sp. AAP83 TaxID=1523425 RepID=UPI0006B88B97|nr:MBL fold metallo-hydrolase [Novosphingobium sp. AAP83]KPF88800.1 MBL fold metallo-hydrolase [Novosphingobium sp. AAP83]